MKKIVTLRVNSVEHTLAVEPQASLLDVLREELGFTGTKSACSGLGECGACTVLVDGEATLACLTFALDAQGKEIVTIEGLAAADGTLHPLQESFVKQGAVQCGFCSPGMILTAKALLDRNPSPSDDEILKEVEGNLCRCTGYNKILQAVRHATGAEKGRVTS